MEIILSFLFFCLHLIYLRRILFNKPLYFSDLESFILMANGREMKIYWWICLSLNLKLLFKLFDKLACTVANCLEYIVAKVISLIVLDHLFLIQPFYVMINVFQIPIKDMQGEKFSSFVRIVGFHLCNLYAIIIEWLICIDKIREGTISKLEK
jgi:hypothetical protein